MLCLPQAKQFSAPSKNLPAHPSGVGGSSLVRRQRSPPAPGPGLAWHAQQEPKRGRAKLFPAHFSALPHLRALGVLQLGSQHPASALQPAPLCQGPQGPGSPEYMAGSSTGWLRRAGRGFGSQVTGRGALLAPTHGAVAAALGSHACRSRCLTRSHNRFRLLALPVGSLQKNQPWCNCPGHVLR